MTFGELPPELVEVGRGQGDGGDLHDGARLDAHDGDVHLEAVALALERAEDDVGGAKRPAGALEGRRRHRGRPRQQPLTREHVVGVARVDDRHLRDLREVVPKHPADAPPDVLTLERVLRQSIGQRDDREDRLLNLRRFLFLALLRLRGCALLLVPGRGLAALGGLVVGLGGGLLRLGLLHFLRGDVIGHHGTDRRHVVDRVARLVERHGAVPGVFHVVERELVPERRDVAELLGEELPRAADVARRVIPDQQAGRGRLVDGLRPAPCLRLERDHAELHLREAGEPFDLQVEHLVAVVEPLRREVLGHGDRVELLA
jgi:hypothetical protein